MRQTSWTRNCLYQTDSRTWSSLLRLRSEFLFSGLSPKIANQRVDPIALHFDKPPGIQVREPSPSGLSQSVQLGRFQRFPPLDQPQPLSKDLARVLVPARGHEVAYNPLMVVGQNDVPCGHPIFSLRRKHA